jgi:hypothetical protein
MSHELECLGEVQRGDSESTLQLTVSVFHDMSSLRNGTFIFILFCGMERSEAGNLLERVKKRKN